MNTIDINCYGEGMGDLQEEFEGADLIKRIINYNEEVEVFKPNFADDDTAFERLLFTCIGLFFRIVRKVENSEDYMSGNLQFSFWNKDETRVGIKNFSFGCADELLISLFDGIYNFYPDIDRANSDDQSNVDDTVAYDIVNVEVAPSSGAGKIAFRLTRGRMNRGKGQLIPRDYTKNYKDYTHWRYIGKQIKTKLYADDSVIEDINHKVNEMENVSKEIWNDIFSDDTYDEIYNGKIVRPPLYKFPKLKHIEIYNEYYYELAKLFIREYSVFTQSDAAQQIVNEVLNFGVMPKKLNRPPKVRPKI